MDYQTLQEQIANHLVSAELVPFVPTAISFAEAELNRRLRVRETLARAFATLDAEFLALPEDFNVLRSMHLTASPGRRLEFLPIETLQRTQPRYPSPGRPWFFSIVGDSFQMLPAPDTAYEVEIAYHARLPELSDVQTTNWLLTRNPDIYLYGALVQASPYLHQDARMALWSSLYEKGLKELALQSERAEFSGGALKMRARAL